tara:strand:- start:1284 stop:2069 length:786 start_codon:yes stop_codon:yes gene_type:complete
MISLAINSEKIPRLELFFALLLTFGISLVIAPIIFSKNLEMNESIVQKVNITGDLRYTSKKQLTDALGPLVESSILLTDLNLIRSRLEAISSIYKVSVRRRWPYRLDINLIEQIPIARWGDSQLINNQGDIFECPGNSSDWIHLPRLDGLRGDAVEVIAIYRKINEVLSQIDQKIVALRTGDLRQLEITLNGGAELFLNKENFLYGLRRFVSHISHLNVNDEDIERVDLRYVNGFALVFKEKVLNEENQNLHILQEIIANG